MADWALILGASSGFGGAVSLELAKKGINIFGVHLDRKATLPNVEKLVTEIKETGAQAIFFNVNAADEAKRASVIESIKKELSNDPQAQIKVLLHSLAFGTLKPYFAEDPKTTITKAHIDMTLDVMAHSLVYWTQDLHRNKLLGKGSRIYAMTSAGGTRVWKTYGAVSAAKAALESHIRQIALELSPEGVTANTILAGVTDTPALRKIPGSEDMINVALRKNPGERLTTPEDIAKAIAAISGSSTQWMTGNVIRVDGGECIVE